MLGEVVQLVSSLPFRFYLFQSPHCTGRAAESAPSPHFNHFVGMDSSTAQVRHGAQGVIEAVREIRRANHQRELDDLPVIEKFSHLREGSFADRRATPVNASGMQNYGLPFLSHHPPP